MRAAGFGRFTLAHCRVGRVLVVVDEAAWQAPLAVAGLDRAATQNDPTVCLNHDGRRNLGIAPQDETVDRTHLELAAFDGLDGKRRAAVDAEVTHRRRM